MQLKIGYLFQCPPGQRPGLLWTQNCRPVRAKALKYQVLPFYLFNVRNQDILINLTIVLMGSKAERNRHQLARSILTLRHIAEHCRSVLVLILAAHLLEDDVAFHHLSVLTFLTLHSEGLTLLHHSHYLSIHII